MTTQSMLINVPVPLYENLKQRADEAKRSVEEETLELLATALPMESVLPDELVDVIEALNDMDVSELWTLARGHLPANQSERLEALHLNKQREELAHEEQAELSQLVQIYERTMLVRAKAIALLKERGANVSELVA